MDRLDSNELLDICKKKNDAYGHGIGTTKPTTSHDAALHRMACLKMVNPTDGAPTSGGAHPTDAAPKRKRTDTPAHEDGTAKHARPWHLIGLQ